MLLVVVTIVCWSIAVWLFWKWDIGCFRSEIQKGNDPKSK